MEKKSILKQVKLYLFDMDGTLYLGDKLFDFTADLLKAIRKAGGRYLFMTNNSSKSVEDYIIKLQKLGIHAEYEDFITSSQATVYYMKKHHPNACLYVCGTGSLKDEFRKEGFRLTEDPEQTDCIVMGFDTELTFQKLKDISYMLCTKDLPYIATNPDYVCPTEFGSVPDCGSVCDMLYNVSGKRPRVIGKPEPLMPLLAMERTGYTKAETAVVGDRIYTDIKSGLNAGTVSILVMSGETTPEVLEQSKDRPDLVLSSGMDILHFLRDENLQ